MGNQEQRTVLSRGISAWNQWRQISPEVEPDLSGFDLGKENFAAIHFSHANLSGTLLNGTVLRGAQLDNADLSSAELIGADLRDANLRNASLVRADLQGANLQGADLRGANLREAFLGGVDASNANFRTAELDHAQMIEATLVNVDLSETSLNETSFHHSRLMGTNFQRTRLYDVNFSDANLSKVNFQNAFFQRVNLNGTLLVETDFRFATLIKTQFHATRFQQTCFASAIFGWNFFGAVDLRGATDLETVEHLGPSEISSNAFYKSQGMIPQRFLLGAGVPLTLIEQLPLLVKEPIERLTCFICCSRADQSLAQRLQQDLRQARIRCWIAFMGQESVQHFWYIQDDPTDIYDTLILLFSSHAVISEMKTLMAIAREKEQQQQKKVMIPLYRENGAEDGIKETLREVFSPRPVFDFTDWQTSNAYQQLFQMVLEQVLGTE